MKKAPAKFLDMSRVTGEARGEYVEFRLYKETVDTLKVAVQTCDELKAAHAVEVDKLRRAHASALFLAHKIPAVADMLALESKRVALETELAEARKYDVRETSQRPIKVGLGGSLIEHLVPPGATACDNVRWMHADLVREKQGPEAAAEYIKSLKQP